MALYAFDGTWNENEQLEDTTNVVRFAEIYKKQSTAVEYVEGVGTRFGVLGQVLGGLFGSGGRSRVHEMYDELNRRAILPHETLGTPVAKYSFTYGANWISPSTPCVRFNFAQKPIAQRLSVA
jgi:hypothetical protein